MAVVTVYNAEIDAPVIHDEVTVFGHHLAGNAGSVMGISEIEPALNPNTQVSVPNNVGFIVDKLYIFKFRIIFDRVAVAFHPVEHNVGIGISVFRVSRLAVN